MVSASSTSLQHQQHYQQQQQFHQQDVQQYQQLQHQEEQHLSFEEFQRQKREQEFQFQQQQLQFQQKQQQFKQQRLQIQQQQLQQHQQQYRSTSSFQQYDSDNGFYAQNSLLGSPPSPQVPRASRTAFQPAQQQQRSYENGYSTQQQQQQQSIHSSQQFNEFSSRETVSRSSGFQDTVGRRSEPHFLKPLPNVLYFSEGQPARLEIEVAGNPTPQISWFKDNYVVCHSEDCQIISNKGSHVLKMPEIYIEDSGLYKAVITSSLGKNETVCQVIVDR